MTRSAQKHEIALGIFKWFSKQGVLEGGKFLMSDIKQTITPMSAVFYVVLSCMSHGGKRRIRRELKLPFASEDEIERKNRDSSCNKLRQRFHLE